MAVQLPDSGFITGGVGNLAGNDVADVLWVQGLLNRWRALHQMAALTVDGEFGPRTGEAIKEFQTRVLGPERATGKVSPGDVTTARMLAYESAWTIVVHKDFATDLDGVALNGVLLNRVLRLCRCLLDIGAASGNITLKQGVRSPKVAHRWSTSWNIRQGRVSLTALQALPNGKDLDGNLWYSAAWEEGLAKDAKGVHTDTAVKELLKKAHAQAATYYSSNAIAAEGYRLDDPKIKPNGHRSVSNHVDGRAMDVSIPWRAGAKFFGRAIASGKTDDNVANRIVAAFRLSRPVKSERWHFQLPADDSRGFVAENNFRIGGPMQYE